MIKIIGFLLILLLIVISTSTLQASGYSVFEQNAKAAGMAGAVVASIDNPSAIFFNPAGISFLPNSQISGGLNLSNHQTKISGANPYPGKNTEETSKFNLVDYLWFPQLNAYFTHQLSDKVTFGFGIFNPYRYETSWDSSFSGKYILTNACISAYYFEPVIAYRPRPDISFAIGFDWVVSYMKFKKKDSTLFSTGNVAGNQTAVLYDVSETEVSGYSYNGIGFTLSMMFVLLDDINLGLMYRHRVHSKYNLTSVTDQSTINSGSETDGFVNSQTKAKLDREGREHDVEAEFDYPGNFAFGVSYFLSDQLMVEADLLYYFWSVNNNINFKYDDPSLNNKRFTNIQQDFSDSWQLRLGAEYIWDKEITLRAGIGFDQSAQPKSTLSPLISDGHTIFWAFGGTYRMSKDLTVDGALTMFYSFPVDSVNSEGRGTSYRSYDAAYQSNRPVSFTISVGANYIFDFKPIWKSTVGSLLESAGLASNDGSMSLSASTKDKDKTAK